MDVEPLSERTRARLRALRGGLLRLHKLLLDGERGAYEREHGRVAAGEMLQLVINDARFAWLRRVSELIVAADEMLDAKEEPATEADARSVVAQARALVSPAAADATEFAEKYRAALQRDPAIVMAHAEVARALAPED
ncbi:MAG TPA: hypothetical protein VF538_14885 [Pyrinomonadaceae bacterium]|jgi:hypothetical protein